MAFLSLEDKFKENNRSALIGISQALHSLVRSLEEFWEVETMLGSECVPAAYQSGSHDCHTIDASPEYLGVVASTLKEMVGQLVQEIEAMPDIQKLLRLIQDATITKELAGLVGTVPLGRGPEVVCTSGTDAKRVERAVTCRHSCEFHPELMDPSLWRKLPQELVQLIFARLFLAKIFELCVQSSVWSTMSRTSNFRRSCSEQHSKLLGFVGLDEANERVWDTVYYTKSDKWIKLELRGRSLTDDVREW